jgi:hypothetical protein
MDDLRPHVSDDTPNVTGEERIEPPTPARACVQSFLVYAKELLGCDHRADVMVDLVPAISHEVRQHRLGASLLEAGHKVEYAHAMAHLDSRASLH